MSQAAEDALMDFGGFAMDAINILQREVRNLREQLEAKEREVEALSEALDRRDGLGEWA